MIKMSDNKGLSVVVPFLNEEESVTVFCSEIDKFASSLSFPLELVFVDDGSTDNTVEIISQYAFHYVVSAKIVKLSKNFGSHAAIRAGIRQAEYDICTWIDCDLQAPLSFITEAYQLIGQGYDAVYLEKKSVKVSLVSRMFSKMYAHMMKKYAVKNFSSNGINNAMFNRTVMDYMNENVEANSNIMLQMLDAGFKSVTLSMDFHERVIGKSKWTLGKKIKLFIDSFVSFSFAPIRLVSILGVLMFFAGLIGGIMTLINRIITPEVPAGYSTLISVIAVGFGITNISLGIIAEYLWRTFDAARSRPTFVISEIINIKQ